MDIQKHIDNAILIVKTSPVVVVLGGFVIVILNLFSLCALSGPLIGGYLLMMIHILRDGKVPDFNDLFVGFRQFGHLLTYLFVLVFIVIGFFFFVIPGLVMLTWWIYSLMLMADQKMSFTEAMTASRAKVDEQGFFMHLVFVFMITVVPSLLINFMAAIFPPLEILQLLLMPFQCGCMASLYLEQFSPVQLEKKGPRGIESAQPPPPPVV